MNLSRRRLAAALTALCLTTVLTLTGGITAAAAEPPPDPTISGTGIKQELPPTSQGGPTVQQAALELIDSIRAIPAAVESGKLVGTQISRDGKQVTAFWNGATSPALLALPAPENVVLKIVAVPYNALELDAEARRLAGAHPSIASVGPASDFLGMRISLKAGSPAADRTAVTSRYPITYGPERNPKALDRFVDTPPFYGGSFLRSRVGGAYCTSGWPVKINNSSREGIVTANHCGPGNWWNGADSQFIGNVERANAGIDAQVLTGTSYGSHIYRGGIDSGFFSRVGTWADPSIGLLVCEGGAFSGEICGAYVQEINQYANVDGNIVGPGWWAEWNGDSYASAGQGDSGGPAFTTYNFNGAIKVRIVGMISAGELDFYGQRCRGISGDRLCSGYIFHGNVSRINSALSVAPKTL